jgi:hypothetical protein
MCENKTIASPSVRKILKIAFYSDLHAVRCILFLSEFLWGLTLLLPGDTLIKTVYTGMTLIMSETMWGILWLIMSAIQLAIIVKGDYHSSQANVFAAINSLIWWYAVISMYLSVYPPHPSIISGDIALAVAASWVYIRTGWTPVGFRISHSDRIVHGREVKQ